ncbi:MAG: BtrH N-terminal domain-containing protein, partial [Candidatus Heimdallarchaeota archaeon]
MSHIIKNFIHRVGYHCESSSMRDLFEFHGFPMSEAMAFGLDGSMGFGFFEQSERMKDFVEPFFIGGKQDTINPNSLACRVLGLTLRKQSFSSADKAWQESKILLDKDIPLILQVDIGYLPFQGFEEEVHFGGHAITLAGYDDEQEIAYIGDTEFEGLQEILIKDLKQARSSEKGSPWMYPKNAQYSMTPRPDGKRPPLAAGVKLSIQKVCNHMLRPSMNYHGVQGLKRFAHSILKWDEVLKGIFNNPYTNKEQSLARTMFELTYGYLETWGTGGAAFRKLYKEFMVE